MISDEPPTRERRITDVRGVPIVQSDDPALYLTQEPTPEEHALSQQVGLHNGAPVPFWMVAKVIMRLREQALWVGSMQGLFRRMRRYASAGLATLAVNLTAIGGYALHRASASGAAEERSAAQERLTQEHRAAVEREIQDLRLDIRELRAALRRMSGADSGPAGPGADMFRLPDKFSFVPQELPHANFPPK